MTHFSMEAKLSSKQYNLIFIFKVRSSNIILIFEFLFLL